MKYMILMKASQDSEAGVMPSDEQLARMGQYNEELLKAGVLVGGEGLAPSAMGARVKFVPGGQPVVTDGPFAGTKDLLAGFWIFEVKSKEEAIDWVKHMPNITNAEYEVEIRKIFGTEDFPQQDHPAIQREYEMREELESKHNAR